MRKFSVSFRIKGCGSILLGYVDAQSPEEAIAVLGLWKTYDGRYISPSVRKATSVVWNRGHIIVEELSELHSNTELIDTVDKLFTPPPLR